MVKDFIVGINVFTRHGDFLYMHACSSFVLVKDSSVGINDCLNHKHGDLLKLDAGESFSI